MIDANTYVRDILKAIDGVRLVFFHPDETWTADDWKKQPVICYYELTTTTGLCYDNAEQGQHTSMQIDIYATKPVKTAELATEVDRLMQENDFLREMSMDIAPEDGIRHKTMRFSKTIYF